jgi:hypothetical protein
MEAPRKIRLLLRRVDDSGGDFSRDGRKEEDHRHANPVDA